MNVERFRQLLREVVQETKADSRASEAERVIATILLAKIGQLDPDATLAFLDTFKDASVSMRGKVRAKLMKAPR